VIDLPDQRYAPEGDLPMDFATQRRIPHALDPGRVERETPGIELGIEPGSDDEGQSGAQRLRLRLPRKIFRLPRSLWGRLIVVAFLLLVAGCVAMGLAMTRTFFLRDPRFLLPSADNIQITGNTHLTRAQILDPFGGDIERNLFLVPLAERRSQLESFPWVAHATVLRLLPNQLRVHILERTPVAFVREGTQIGLVDAGGVLLDMPPDRHPGAAGDPLYSFPVVTGINAQDPLSTRFARMKLYTQFAADLDSAGEKISQNLSEVDLSDPEDVKALIPENGSEILVHFGDTDFLKRYQKFQQLLPEWRAQYPKLASVDMRYEGQVVLDMQPGAAAGPDANAVADAPANPGSDGATKATIQTATKAATQTGTKPSVRPAPGPKAISGSVSAATSRPNRTAVRKPGVALRKGSLARKPHPPAKVSAKVRSTSASQAALH